MFEHLIPLIFTLLVAGVLYYYFKNKILAIENKVNLMFQLIQEHNKTIQLRNNQPSNTVSLSQEQHSIPQTNEPLNNPNNLIHVSDNEVPDENDCDTDSDIDNDCDSEFSDTENSDDNDDMKTHNADNLKKLIQVNMSNAGNIVEENVGLDDKDDLDCIQLDNSDAQNVTSENDTDDDDVETLGTFETSQVEETEVEPTKVEPNSANTLSEELSSLNVEDNVLEEVKKNTSDNFSKLTLKQLKDICATKGLTNIANLRKKGLIELLEKTN